MQLRIQDKVYPININVHRFIDHCWSCHCQFIFENTYHHKKDSIHWYWMTDGGEHNDRAVEPKTTSAKEAVCHHHQQQCEKYTHKIHQNIHWKYTKIYTNNQNITKKLNITKNQNIIENQRTKEPVRHHHQQQCEKYTLKISPITKISPTKRNITENHTSLIHLT